MYLFKLRFQQAQPPFAVIGVAVSAGSTALHPDNTETLKK